MTAATLERKRTEILQIATTRGARNVRVFGSVARGDGCPGSDVDFLVDMEPGRSYLDFVALWLDLRELLCVEVDVLTERGLSPYLRDEVLREARPL